MKSFICPTMAVDKIHFKEHCLNNVVGGSATYAALASSIFCETALSSIVGNDFPLDYLDLLESKGVDISGVYKSKRKSFHWEARYSADLGKVTTIKNEMNAFEDYDAKKVKPLSKDSFAAFVSNIDPEIQGKIVKNLPKNTIKILDSMELWMIEKRDHLIKVLEDVDVFTISEGEAKFLVGKDLPLPEMIETLMLLGPKVIVYKKGEHGLSVYGKLGNFIVPSYPLVYAVDPTGAGDVLGGAIAGVLSALGRFDMRSMRTAALLGSILASYTVEAYGTEILESITKEEVLNRTSMFLTQLPCEKLESDLEILRD
ncbi:PfkB family carbohydrate kinase [Patescibacteria group bacterium]